MKKHAVILIPGLGDRVVGEKLLVNFWKRHGFGIYVAKIGWHDGESFAAKLNKLSRKADKLKDKYENISVIGTSAGGSAALNLLCENPKSIHKAVNVCGRLRRGTNKGWRGFGNRTASSPSFRESVIMFSRREKELSNVIRNKMMTVRPLLGDELVPGDTVTVNGAKNITVPVGQHWISIALSLTLFSGKITEFINS